jgi:hypothetical protein
LEKNLNKKFPGSQFASSKPERRESSVRFVLRGVDLSDEPEMHGNVMPPAPQLEDLTTWVRIKERPDALMVEMQHDRLFLPGSAYLRDASLPQLTAALERVRQEPKEKKIYLRSYKEKPLDRKREKKEEDPKLAALRTKVLFSLFARERFLP